MIMIRLFGLAAAGISYWIITSQWEKLATEGVYSLRYAVLAPMIGVMGLFIFLFPKYIGKPETTSEKVIVMFVFLLGVAAGFYNLYLMDPASLGF